MLRRTDIINMLIKKYSFKSYLEIGTDTGVNLRNVICENKDSVDPVRKCNELKFEMTSDDFFASLNSKMKWDIIFIDGLHLAEQVEKDFYNAAKHLNKNGLIVLHDTNPKEQKFALEIPNNGTWNGTTYQFMIKLASSDKDFSFFTVNTDHGVSIVKNQHRPTLYGEGKANICDWNHFVVNKKVILNLISTKEFIGKMK